MACLQENLACKVERNTTQIKNEAAERKLLRIRKNAERMALYEKEIAKIQKELEEENARCQKEFMKKCIHIQLKNVLSRRRKYYDRQATLTAQRVNKWMDTTLQRASQTEAVSRRLSATRDVLKPHKMAAPNPTSSESVSSETIVCCNRPAPGAVVEPVTACANQRLGGPPALVSEHVTQAPGCVPPATTRPYEQPVMDQAVFEERDARQPMRTNIAAATEVTDRLRTTYYDERRGATPLPLGQDDWELCTGQDDRRGKSGKPVACLTNVDSVMDESTSPGYSVERLESHVVISLSYKRESGIIENTRGICVTSDADVGTNSRRDRARRKSEVSCPDNKQVETEPPDIHHSYEYDQHQESRERKDCVTIFRAVETSDSICLISGAHTAEEDDARAHYRVINNTDSVAPTGYSEVVVPEVGTLCSNARIKHIGVNASQEPPCKSGRKIETSECTAALDEGKYAHILRSPDIDRLTSDSSVPSLQRDIEKEEAYLTPKDKIDLQQGYGDVNDRVDITVKREVSENIRNNVLRDAALSAVVAAPVAGARRNSLSAQLHSSFGNSSEISNATVYYQVSNHADTEKEIATVAHSQLEFPDRVTSSLTDSRTDPVGLFLNRLGLEHFEGFKQRSNNSDWCRFPSAETMAGNVTRSHWSSDFRERFSGSFVFRNPQKQRMACDVIEAVKSQRVPASCAAGPHDRDEMHHSTTTGNQVSPRSLYNGSDCIPLPVVTDTGQTECLKSKTTCDVIDAALRDAELPERVYAELVPGPPQRDKTRPATWKGALQIQTPAISEFGEFHERLPPDRNSDNTEYDEVGMPQCAQPDSSVHDLFATHGEVMTTPASSELQAWGSKLEINELRQRRKRLRASRPALDYSSYRGWRTPPTHAASGSREKYWSTCLRSTDVTSDSDEPVVTQFQTHVIKKHYVRASGSCRKRCVPPEEVGVPVLRFPLVLDVRAPPRSCSKQDRFGLDVSHSVSDNGHSDKWTMCKLVIKYVCIAVISILYLFTKRCATDVSV